MANQDLQETKDNREVISVDQFRQLLESGQEVIENYIIEGEEHEENTIKISRDAYSREWKNLLFLNHIEFKDLKTRPDFKIINCKFNSRCTFNNCRFQEKVALENNTINKFFIFRKSFFERELLINNLSIAKNIVKPNGLIINICVFDSSIRVNDSKFYGDIHINQCHIGEDIIIGLSNNQDNNHASSDNYKYPLFPYKNNTVFFNNLIINNSTIINNILLANIISSSICILDCFVHNNIEVVSSTVDVIEYSNEVENRRSKSLLLYESNINKELIIGPKATESIILNRHLKYSISRKYNAEQLRINKLLINQKVTSDLIITKEHNIEISILSFYGDIKSDVIIKISDLSLKGLTFEGVNNQGEIYLTNISYPVNMVKKQSEDDQATHSLSLIDTQLGDIFFNSFDFNSYPKIIIHNSGLSNINSIYKHIPAYMKLSKTVIKKFNSNIKLKHEKNKLVFFNGSSVIDNSFTMRNLIIDMIKDYVIKGAVYRPFITGLSFRKREVIYIIEPNTIAETYNQLFVAMKKQGNKTMEMKYYAAYQEWLRLDLKFKQEQWATRTALWLNKTTTNYGLNWGKGVAWIVGTWLVFYGLFALATWWYNGQPTDFLAKNDVWSSLFKFFLPTHRIDNIITSYPTKPAVAYAIDVLYRLVVGFLIYQTIAAFRRFGKR